MIENLHKRYICVSPVFRGGRLYNPGDILLLPDGEEYTGKKFSLVPAVEPQPEQEQKPKKRKKNTSEEEV